MLHGVWSRYGVSGGGIKCCMVWSECWCEVLVCSGYGRCASMERKYHIIF